MSTIPDERLALIFTCCHPALSLEAQVALTLRLLGGLTTPEIARAFLVPRRRWRSGSSAPSARSATPGSPSACRRTTRCPSGSTAVLAILYLIFNEGYSDASRTSSAPRRSGSAAMLAALMPDEPEVLGLLALMLLHDSRADARSTTTGGSSCSRTRTARAGTGPRSPRGGCSSRRRCGGGGPGRTSSRPRSPPATPAATSDWPQIVALYGELLRLQPSPVVELNRAVAVAMAAAPSRPRRGRRDRRARRLPVSPLDARGPAPPPRRHDEARVAYERALELDATEAERGSSSAAVAAQPGIAATASISSSAPGTASAETSTSVLAGRASPKNSWRTGLIFARSSMSSRKDDLEDVGEAAAGGLQAQLHVAKDLARLLDDVALADELPLGVDRDDPGDEQQPAGADRIGVVADRLGQPFDSQFLPVMAHERTIQSPVEPQFVDFQDVRAFELAAGVNGRPLFGEGAMLNLIEFEPGSTVPLHSHEHEQLGIVLQGVQVLIVDGKEHALGPMQGYVLPGGVEHSAYCGPEGALVLDVFRPVREDYRERWHSLP